MTLVEVEACTVLRATVGSTVHGTSVGSDDRDEMGICVEPYRVNNGLSQWEQLVFRTATERTGKIDARSMPGDLDLVVYSLRKYVSLALKGNPTILLLLFTGENIVRTPIGAELQGISDKIISRHAGQAFLGFMQAQYYRLTGERGQKGVNRPELVEKYGFDTKYAGHVVRLGYQGLELLTTGRLSLPLVEPYRSNVVDIRNGKYPLPSVIETCKRLEQQLKDELNSTSLRAEPDRKFVEDWMLEAYWRTWHDRCL